MRITPLLLLSGVIAMIPALAFAYPDGAPWGSADPNAVQNCSSCHFDGEVFFESEAIRLFVSPIACEERSVLPMRLTLVSQHASVAGFAMRTSAGEFFNNEQHGLESAPQELRSTTPVKLKDAEIGWPLLLLVKDQGVERVTLDVAINAANNDGSPFSDEIHYRTFEVSTCQG